MFQAWAGVLENWFKDPFFADRITKKLLVKFERNFNLFRWSGPNRLKLVVVSHRRGKTIM